MLYSRPEITEQERRWSEARMMKSFQTMKNRYDEQRSQLRARKPWVENKKKSSAIPPSDMTVTHVNQTKEIYVCYITMYLFYYIYKYTTLTDVFCTSVLDRYCSFRKIG